MVRHGNRAAKDHDAIVKAQCRDDDSKSSKSGRGGEGTVSKVLNAAAWLGR